MTHRGEPHTIRSHRMSELRHLKDNGTVVGAQVAGKIVHINMGNDGAPRSIVIHDGLGNYYSLPSLTILELAPDD